MSINPNLLISSSFGNLTSYYLNGGESVSIYINDLITDVNIANGTAATLSNDDETRSFIWNSFSYLDPLIDLDFQIVENPDEAILRIYSVSDFDLWSQQIVGEVSNQSNYWDILWRDTSVSSLSNFDKNTIIHEIGHSLGLSHPNEDPTNPNWTTDDTIMSYNISPDGWDYELSPSDILALEQIWGTEDDLSSPADPINAAEPIEDFYVIGSEFNDRLIGFEGDNTYQFNLGRDVIDYSNLQEAITFSLNGEVFKGSQGTDTHLDFAEKLIATNLNNDWIDGVLVDDAAIKCTCAACQASSILGESSSLEINLAKKSLLIHTPPGIDNIQTKVTKFENISGSNNADILIGARGGNEIQGNGGDDYISGGKGGDMLSGGAGNDTFFYANNRESRLSRSHQHIDWITDFNTGEDIIDFSNEILGNTFQVLGEVEALNRKNINLLLSESNSLSYHVISFSDASTGKTFLAANGSDDGFQPKNDSLVEITGYSGNLSDIQII